MNVDTFIDGLAEQGRVLVLGGLAVIAHGLARSTRDADIWLDPLASEDEWASALRTALSSHPGTVPYDLRAHAPVEAGEIERVVSRDGVIRVTGLDRPLDVFRVPHNMVAADFDAVWQRSGLTLGSVRVPDEVDLLVTKEETGRPHDIADISFLEEKVRRRLGSMLRACPLEEAEAIFARYADHETCRAALANKDDGVRQLAVRTLRRFADDGDPFALEILRTVRGD